MNKIRYQTKSAMIRLFLFLLFLLGVISITRGQQLGMSVTYGTKNTLGFTMEYATPSRIGFGLGGELAVGMGFSSLNELRSLYTEVDSYTTEQKYQGDAIAYEVIVTNYSLRMLKEPELQYNVPMYLFYDLGKFRISGGLGIAGYSRSYVSTTQDAFYLEWKPPYSNHPGERTYMWSDSWSNNWVDRSISVEPMIGVAYQPGFMQYGLQYQRSVGVKVGIGFNFGLMW